MKIDIFQIISAQFEVVIKFMDTAYREGWLIYLVAVIIIFAVIVIFFN
mgnify:CR=1 FL=1|jgi:hypothetical protein|tara:strand:- start:6154 stop:6297 length:144 start_codon:yes stop_codon:yes gene_type:complete